MPVRVEVQDIEDIRFETDRPREESRPKVVPHRNKPRKEAKEEAKGESVIPGMSQEFDLSNFTRITCSFGVNMTGLSGNHPIPCGWHVFSFSRFIVIT